MNRRYNSYEKIVKVKVVDDFKINNLVSYTFFVSRKFWQEIWIIYFHKNVFDEWMKRYKSYGKIDTSNPGESIGLKFIPSQLELFRFIPISVSEPMRIIPNQSEKCFISCLMKNGQISILLNLIKSENWSRMNPNQSELEMICTEFLNNLAKVSD